MNIPFIIITFFIIIWIISSVIKASAKANDRTRRNLKSSSKITQRGSTKINTNTTSDVDRFLQEIDRLRKSNPSQTPPPPVKPVRKTKAPPTKASDQSRSVDNGNKNFPTIPSVSAGPAVPQVRSVEEPHSPNFPVSKSSTSPVAHTQIQSAHAPVSDARSAAKLAPIIPAKASHPEKVSKSPISELVQTLLKSKEGKGASLILAEIFAPPKGMRKPNG